VVNADRGFVTQVLANLVQNAGRYRDEDRPLVITLAAACDGPSWVVAVSDSGKGISTDELERVFEAGARGRSAEGTDGTGTGLATVRTLMDRMGGEVWAEPLPGGGVRICLRFAPAD
jgi:signal transduction histidine kinase